MSLPEFKNQFELRKYLQENPDPFNIKENGYKEYTLEEVAQHKEKPSIWSIFKGDVYDITPYVSCHPGGEKILRQVYGKDMTGMYNKFHAYVNIKNLIGPLKIGTVKQSKSNFIPNPNFIPKPISPNNDIK